MGDGRGGVPEAGVLNLDTSWLVGFGGGTGGGGVGEYIVCPTRQGGVNMWSPASL